MYDVIIIGSGPAGISAALYTQRGGLKTLIISKGSSSLEKHIRYRTTMDLWKKYLERII